MALMLVLWFFCIKYILVNIAQVNPLLENKLESKYSSNWNTAEIHLLNIEMNIHLLFFSVFAQLQLTILSSCVVIFILKALYIYYLLNHYLINLSN